MEHACEQKRYTCWQHVWAQADGHRGAVGSIRAVQLAWVPSVHVHAWGSPGHHGSPKKWWDAHSFWLYTTSTGTTGTQAVNFVSKLLQNNSVCIDIAIRHINKLLGDFPGGAVVQNLPANAGDTGSIPGLRRSYMPQSNKPVSHNYWARVCATTTEARAPRAPCSTTREATAVRSPSTARKNSPCAPQLEKAHVQQQRPNAAENKLKKKKVTRILQKL